MYIGPGAGFAIATSFLTFLIGLVGSFVSLLLWPLRMVWRWLRFRKVYARAHFKKLIFIGFDGLDPRLTERWMDEGKLPNLARLRAEGDYKRLRTTFPALSPVAWSTFATGVNPAKHNIFDFLSRARGTYLPELAPAVVKPARRVWKVGRFRIPLSRPVVESRRKSESFWTILGRHQIRSNVIRVPVTFPPEKFNGQMLSAMCTPDLRGTQGSFTVFEAETLKRRGEWLLGELRGPDELVCPVEMRDGELRIQGRRFALRLGEYTPWIRITFGRVRGIVRFLMTSNSPLSVYATPVQIDPQKPALPISHPRLYALYLSQLLGSFSTLGLAEDTWACNEGAISNEDFLKQAYLIFEERRRMFSNALKKTRRGVVGCVFDTSDRVQHLFFRQHEEGLSRTVEDMYARMDEVVGEAFQHVDRDTLLMVLSDHGFCRFSRGVNLNAWLREHGYLQMSGEGIDWGGSSVYALGLAGLYVNVRGREPEGIVEPGDAAALKREIIQKLAGLRDGETVAIAKVYDTAQIYRGPYLEGSPDLIVGYAEGYRAAWGAALGEVSSAVFEDNDKPWSGDHCVDPALVPGVLFANRKIDAASPGMEDMAPTALRSFGIDPPSWMDGRAVFTF